MGKFSVDPSERRKAVPAGEYVVMVKSAVEKTPTKGTNDYIEVGMEIIEGEYKGEVVFDRFFPKNEKARGRLSSFIVASGLADAGSKGMQEFDTGDLIDRVLVVKGRPEERNGFESFRPTSFSSYQHEEAPAEAPAQEAPAPAPAAAPAKAPAPAAKPAPAKPVARKPI